MTQHDQWAPGSAGAPSVPSAQQPPPDSEGIAPLISGLLADLQNLVRNEVQLAKLELKEDASSAIRGLVMIVAGAILALVGLIITMIALAILLDEWLNDWVAFGVVGVGLLIIASIAAMAGKKQLRATQLSPDQTIESLKEDKEWAKQQISSVKN